MKRLGVLFVTGLMMVASWFLGARWGGRMADRVCRDPVVESGLNDYSYLMEGAVKAMLNIAITNGVESSVIGDMTQEAAYWFPTVTETNTVVSEGGVP